MNRQIFLDTNILVYAHDVDAGKKNEIARKKVSELWEQKVPPSISIQVLQELYVNLIKKEVPLKTARGIIDDYLQWDVVQNDSILLVDGIRLKEKLNLSFWDALIVAAAKRAHAGVLWTEDLSEGREYDGIKAENPLID